MLDSHVLSLAGLLWLLTDANAAAAAPSMLQGSSAMLRSLFGTGSFGSGTYSAGAAAGSSGYRRGSEQGEQQGLRSNLGPHEMQQAARASETSEASAGESSL
jgi:hypothetical protein